MALFSRTKKTDAPAKTAEKSVVVPVPKSVKGETIFSSGLAHILRHPHITEKASLHAEKGAYVFNVSTRATKQDIEKAVFTIYKVKPRMVRVATIPSKAKRSSKTGKIGITRGGKKAYVYLKRGETITIS